MALIWIVHTSTVVFFMFLSHIVQREICAWFYCCIFDVWSQMVLNDICVCFNCCIFDVKSHMVIWYCMNRVFVATVVCLMFSHILWQMKFVFVPTVVYLTFGDIRHHKCPSAVVYFMFGHIWSKLKPVFVLNCGIFDAWSYMVPKWHVCLIQLWNITQNSTLTFDWLDKHLRLALPCQKVKRSIHGVLLCWKDNINLLLFITFSSYFLSTFTTFSLACQALTYCIVKDQLHYFGQLQRRPPRKRQRCPFRSSFKVYYQLIKYTSLDVSD